MKQILTFAILLFSMSSHAAVTDLSVKTVYLHPSEKKVTAVYEIFSSSESDLSPLQRKIRKQCGTSSLDISFSLEEHKSEFELNVSVKGKAFEVEDFASCINSAVRG